MINRKMFKSAVIITAIMLSLTACGKKEQPVSAEPAQTIEESTEESVESLEVTPSPTVEPTTEPEEESSSSEESLDNSESEVDTEEESLGYEIIDIEDKTLYATQNCNLRSGPGTDYEKVGSLSYAQQITVNGKVEQDGKIWWVLKSDTEEKQMVSGGLVSETKPATQSSSGNGSSGNSGSTGIGGGTGSSGTGGGSGTGSSGTGGSGGGSSQPPADDGFDAGSIGLPDVGGMQDWGGGGWISE